ncbi:MAG: hypothetical protein HYR96_00855 [Deltaproteobacteria bacterium]|nr:hypothetical protein [Deltaproteobacteria bacterium]MBI3296082.1 hypothetical protein [Deltaproteobacteria bacterium]
MDEKGVRRFGRFLRETRNFFDSRGFTEVMTPNLVSAGAFEATLDCLRVSHEQGQGELHTSPELAMKCLLAEAPIPIYQICKSYRDDPPSPIHFLEFVMLEFYQPQADYREVLATTRSYFECVAGGPLDWVSLTVREAWLRHTGLDLDDLVERDGLAEAVGKRGLATVREGDSWEDLFFKVMIAHVEPNLPEELPVIITDYPGRLCTLLKKRGGIVERFEIYWRGMEICNGGTELGDSEALKVRYAAESNVRKVRGKEPHPFPKAFAEAIEKLPPLAGVAIGMERLGMCIDVAMGGRTRS